ncbi:DsbA family protein [Hyphomicrobium sp.]|jgi:protein-disulfide isomerase|uniref:DsbA family protein n=1 Tax=Hyphomicrobium sp. TaxID=82 RepID=UPI002BF893AA|nr:DsbA family protein [Hyphomicrobium sp.]HVZ06159.1 DsbA family protein [Hyphomicrobium sp.]
MPLVRALAFFAAAVLAAQLGACGATLPQTASITNDASGVGAAYPSTGSEKPDAMPSPLNDSPAPIASGRQVIANPTIADIMAPSPLPEMSWGSPTAPVTIVQYMSLTCPHCRHFHETVYPELKRRFIDTGKVRYILREFPIGKTSGNATIALRCAPPDKYLELYGKFMKQQASWVSLEVRLDAIYAVARQVGMTRPQFDACLQNQGMITNLKWVKDRGRKLGIVGTPNFFIGTKLIKKELTIAEIADYVEKAERQGGTPTAAASP